MLHTNHLVHLRHLCDIHKRILVFHYWSTLLRNTQRAYKQRAMEFLTKHLPASMDRVHLEAAHLDQDLTVSREVESTVKQLSSL